MHTAASLRAEMFEIEVDNRPSSPAELLDWGPFDRLGVMVTTSLGGLGASLLIQLATTCFYDATERKRRQHPIYPEIYLFHVGGRHGTHAAFDFWPPRKEVFEANDPVQLLASINNHGITHLAVPDVPARQVEHHWKEPEAAKDRLKRCFVWRRRHGRKPKRQYSRAGHRRHREQLENDQAGRDAGAVGKSQASSCHASG